MICRVILFICFVTVAPLCGARVVLSGSLDARRATDARTFVDLSPAELAKIIHELRHVQPAESQDPLPEILERVGKTVAAFFSNFPNTACVESVTSNVQTVNARWPSNPSNQAQTAKFNYLALAEPGSDATALREYRTDSKGNSVPMRSSLLVITSGFMEMVIHFHPEFQVDSRVRYVGRQEVNGRDAYVVSFAQKPDRARRPVTIQEKKSTETMFLQGVAWVDPANYGIMRMRTDILKKTTPTDLLWQTTDVEYSEVTFEHGAKTLWLPLEVKVAGEMDQYTFYNEHRYSDYRLFKVQAEEQPKTN